MINRRIYIKKTAGIVFLIIVLLFIVVKHSHAQFIDLQLEVDSKITAQTEQPLGFGTLTTNSGRRMIELGDINMGIFSITALENQMLLVTVNKPSELRHDNPAVDDVIPIDLFSRYGYSAQNYNNSYPLPEATSSIKVEPNPEPGPWNSIYLFMYGSINIGNVQGGVYSNNIVLHVEYL